MRRWKSSGIGGVVRATVAIVAVLGVCGAWPASAEEIGNMVAFKGGFMRLNSDRADNLFTDARNPLGLVSTTAKTDGMSAPGWIWPSPKTRGG